MADATELAALAALRRDFRDCLHRRADALFELTDAVLCTDGPVVRIRPYSLVAALEAGRTS